MNDKKRCVIHFLEDAVVDAILEELLEREPSVTFDDLIYQISPLALNYDKSALGEGETWRCIPLEFEGNHETRGICVEVNYFEEDSRGNISESGYPLDEIFFSDLSLEKIREVMKERSVSKMGTAE